MKNIIILILLGVIAYLLVTSGILNRAVQTVPQLLASTPNPNETPHISVTVYSPYGTGATTPNPNPGATSMPSLAPLPTTVITPIPQSTSIPDVPIFALPTPVIIVPDVPPTLAVSDAPTPAANFKIALDTPRDGDTTNASPLQVTGLTAPNAVVSVNDVVGVASSEGRFSLTVPLQVGPNVLEVIASQPNGQEAFVIVTVLYQP
jgi:hypothetical protein